MKNSPQSPENESQAKRDGNVETIFEKNGHRMVIDYPNFKGEYSIAKLEAVRLVYVQAKVLEEMHVPIEIKEDRVLLYFCLEGSFSASSDVFKKFSFVAATHNVLYTHPLKANFHFLPGKYEAFYITLPFADFNIYFPESESVFENFHRQMKAGYFSMLRENPGILNSQIFRVIREIREFKKDTDFRDIFLKGKLMELLSIQLEELCSLSDDTVPVRKDILEKIYSVRDFISENPEKNYSLNELAQKAGTNEYTLKSEFKKLFGTTVFRFRNDLKMEKAMEMLRKREKTIAEISERIGYKNPQHFSTAFKRNFGVTPSEYQNL